MDLMTRNDAMAREAAAVAERQQRAADLTQQEMDILRLFAVGATLMQMCTVAGVKTSGGALKVVRRVLAKYAAVIDSTPVSEARALMMTRLDLIINGNMPAASMGDEKAGKIALAALHQQARLLGLDAPRRLDVEHHLTDDTATARRGREQAVHASLTEFHSRTIEGETA